MRRIDVSIPKGLELIYATKGSAVLTVSDWRKIRRVLRAAEVVAKHRKHSFRDLRLAAYVAGRAIDALNKEPRK